MSTEHKSALAQGREESRTVRRYLDALEGTRPRRGRKRTPESIQKRLLAIEERMATADSLTRLHLSQEKKDLQAELTRSKASPKDSELASLEKEFIKVAKSYGERKGISYRTWREAGVSTAVLEKAGIARTRGR